MASSYNSRPVSPQVMVDGDTFELVGDRLAPCDVTTRSEREPRTAYRAHNTPVRQVA